MKETKKDLGLQERDNLRVLRNTNTCNKTIVKCVHYRNEGHAFVRVTEDLAVNF